jgi:hypothetical protein
VSGTDKLSIVYALLLLALALWAGGVFKRRTKSNEREQFVPYELRVLRYYPVQMSDEASWAVLASSRANAERVALREEHRQHTRRRPAVTNR